MDNYPYNLTEKNLILYALQFGLMQNFYIPSALIHLISKISNQIDNSNYACDNIIDFFYLPIGCLTVSFGPLSRVQSHLSNFSHFI